MSTGPAWAARPQSNWPNGPAWAARPLQPISPLTKQHLCTQQCMQPALHVQSGLRLPEQMIQADPAAAPALELARFRLAAPSKVVITDSALTGQTVLLCWPADGWIRGTVTVPAEDARPSSILGS